MKNKKLVATVASLCLVVVAVVAAVVGVFAAVNQHVTTTISVSYTANNVYATVSLKSKGPKFISGVRSIAERDVMSDGNDYSTNSGDGWDVINFSQEAENANPVTSKTFYPVATLESTETLRAQTYDFGWSDNLGQPGDSQAEPATDDAVFYDVAIYRFEFINHSTNKTLGVSFSYDSAAESNVLVNFYQSSEGNLGLSDIDTSARTDAGVLSAIAFGTQSSFPAASKTPLTLTAGTGTIKTSSLAAVTANTTSYLYLVVVVADATANAGFTLGGTSNNVLQFNLVSPAA